jgi:hypothetical protein
MFSFAAVERQVTATTAFTVFGAAATSVCAVLVGMKPFTEMPQATEDGVPSTGR